MAARDCRAVAAAGKRSTHRNWQRSRRDPSLDVAAASGFAPASVWSREIVALGLAVSRRRPKLNWGGARLKRVSWILGRDLLDRGSSWCCLFDVFFLIALFV